MRLDARPDLSIGQRVALFDAAMTEARVLLLDGASSVVAESDGDGTLTVTSDRLTEPRVVAVREEG